MAYFFIFFLILANSYARNESFQIETVKGLIDRLLPQRSSEFILNLHPSSVPEYVIIDSKDSKIFLSGRQKNYNKIKKILKALRVFLSPLLLTHTSQNTLTSPFLGLVTILKTNSILTPMKQIK